MNCCSNLPDNYEGKVVKAITELSTNLETDYKSWLTKFKCKVCGQMWCEEYEDKGHGEMPGVYKCNQSS